MQDAKPYHYTRTAKVIHWLMAVLLILQVFMGWELDNQEGAELSESLAYHVQGGLLILGLLLLRLFWRIGNPPPALPDTMARSQKIAAKVIHGLFYVLMAVVPITGIILLSAYDSPVMLGDIDFKAMLSPLGIENYVLRYWYMLMLCTCLCCLF